MGDKTQGQKQNGVFFVLDRKLQGALGDCSWHWSISCKSAILQASEVSDPIHTMGTDTLLLAFHHDEKCPTRKVTSEGMKNIPCLVLDGGDTGREVTMGKTLQTERLRWGQFISINTHQ